MQRFFGMIRSAGGNNDHPNSVNFLYSYKLMSAYSLLKPTPGSNVTGAESFTTFVDLMESNKLVGENEEPVSPYKKWVVQMDNAISMGTVDALSDEEVPEAKKTQYFIVEYFAGYVLRHQSKFIDCADCLPSLTRAESRNDGLIMKRDKFGVLTVPSTSLVALLQRLESIIIEEIGNVSDLKPDSFFIISDKIDDESCMLPLVGCCEHRDRITMFIVQFFLIMRMNMICKTARKSIASSQQSKKLKKESKLV